MNFIPCLAWVAKGIAKSCPDRVKYDFGYYIHIVHV